MPSPQRINLSFAVSAITLMLCMMPGAAYAIECGTAAGGTEHIFGFILYQFTQTLQTVLSQILPVIYGKMTDIVGALASLYILVYGIQIMAGISQLNVKEAMGRMIKVCLAVSLATGGGTFTMMTVNSFFQSLALDVPSWFLSSFPKGFLNISGSGGCALPTSLFNSIDSLFYNIMFGGISSSVDVAKLLSFIAVIASPGAIPPLGAIALYWIWQVFMLLVRAMLFILMALAAIAFLVAMGPIFMCFFLFKATTHVFESWLHHIISYSLQILFVFVAMGLWAAAMSLYAPFFQQLSDAIAPYQKVMVPAPGNATPKDSWGICKTTSASGTSLGCSSVGVTNPDIPASGIIHQTEFMYFFIYNLFSLLLVTHAFSALLQAAPKIAQEIAGASGTSSNFEGIGLSHLNQAVESKAAEATQSWGGSDVSKNFTNQVAQHQAKRPGGKK